MRELNAPSDHRYISAWQPTWEDVAVAVPRLLHNLGLLCDRRATPQESTQVRVRPAIEHRVQACGRTVQLPR